MRESANIKTQNYLQLLEEIKSILQTGLGRAYKAVDNIKVQTYWQIGERITREELQHKDRADYGKSLIESLAKDLGFSRRVMYEIVQFYRIYPIVQAVPAQLSWTHIIYLLNLHDSRERQFYETRTILNAWSTRELEARIKKKEYAKTKNTGQLMVKLPPKLPAPEEVFKDVYHWNFLELEEGHSESQLEQALLDNVQKMLLEFGQVLKKFGFEKGVDYNVNNE